MAFDGIFTKWAGMVFLWHFTSTVSKLSRKSFVNIISFLWQYFLMRLLSQSFIPFFGQLIFFWVV